MLSHAEHSQEHTNQSQSKEHSQKKSSEGASPFQFVDKRPEAIAQRKLQEMVDRSPRAREAARFQNMADNSQRSQNPFQFESTISPTAQLTSDSMNQAEEEQRRKGPPEPFQFSRWAAGAVSEEPKGNTQTSLPLKPI